MGIATEDSSGRDDWNSLQYFVRHDRIRTNHGDYLGTGIMVQGYFYLISIFDKSCRTTCFRPPPWPLPGGVGSNMEAH